MEESDISLTPKQIDHELDESKIINATRQDPKAFGGLYKLYVEQVFRYLYSRLENVHEAEDATAQTFLAAFESFDRFRQDGHFVSWLFAIARNKAMDHFRQRKNTTSIDEVNDIRVDNDPLLGVIQVDLPVAGAVAQPAGGFKWMNGLQPLSLKRVFVNPSECRRFAPNSLPGCMLI